MSATEWHPTTTPRLAGPALRPPVHRLGERLAVVSAPATLDEPTARAFGRAALGACDDGVRELVLDLTAVRRHAWPAVYALCELEARLADACCDPVAAAAQPALVSDLEAVGLDRAWVLTGSRDAAIADLLSRPL